MCDDKELSREYPHLSKTWMMRAFLPFFLQLTIGPPVAPHIKDSEQGLVLPAWEVLKTEEHSCQASAHTQG